MSDFVVLSVDLLRRRETNLCFDKIFCLGWGCPRADDELSLHVFVLAWLPQFVSLKCSLRYMLLNYHFKGVQTPSNKFSDCNYHGFAMAEWYIYNIFNPKKLLIFLVKEGSFDYGLSDKSYARRKNRTLERPLLKPCQDLSAVLLRQGSHCLDGMLISSSFKESCKICPFDWKYEEIINDTSTVALL